MIDCGVDLDAFAPGDAAAARAELGWDGDGPAFLCVGSLIERKNVLRLADAFERHGAGRLAFVGDGPLRPELEGRDGVRLVGRVPQEDVPAWVAACDVLCQPSLIEPFGQATLEAMAMERSVVATTIGGPPEFVTREAGVLVDPYDTDALTAALAHAAALPAPNPAGREVAPSTMSASRRRGWPRCSSARSSRNSGPRGSLDLDARRDLLPCDQSVAVAIDRECRALGSLAVVGVRNGLDGEELARRGRAHAPGRRSRRRDRRAPR